MAQVLTAHLVSEVAGAEPAEERYEIQWTIPRWREVRRSESLLNCQVGVFETGSHSSAWFKTKWFVGLTLVPGRVARVYWKLMEIKGSESNKVEAKLQTQLLISSTGKPKYTDEKIGEVQLLEIVEETGEGLQFRPDLSAIDGDVISNRNNVRYTLKLTLKTPTMTFSEYQLYRMDQFSKKSKDQLRQDQEALLNNQFENADLKFITSDEVEIPAHKMILKARCPVFAAMFNSDLSENATGIIRLTDITAKTLRILLHYFYTGELLDSWEYLDMLEFTYAAGKYQMTEVLKLLDDMLGRYDDLYGINKEVNNLDVQLISLAAKLKLEKAEERLLERIVSKIKTVKASGEIFKLFGFEEQEISKMANMRFGGSRIMKTMEFLYGADDSEVCLKNGMIMLAKARKEKLGKMEENLLKCFAEKVKLVKNAEELFELFGRGKQMGK